tara:strand:- start:11657 stop:12100 length:444 start_codon:yes stop_codon:yes gene_type:complete
MATRRVLSREDTNLTSSIITTRKVQFKDIDLSFTAKPNGEIYTKKDAAAVKQAVKNLILTNHFEKPFLPFFGGNVRDLLFDLADEDIEEDVEERIIEAINAYEPRAAVRTVNVKSDPDRNNLNVYIEFQVINTTEVVTFTTTLSRLR